MIRNQYANDIHRYTQLQYAIRIYTQFTQYRNSIRTNTRIYANGIYAQIRRIYANDLRIQYAWYAINTQSIRIQYAMIRNMQYANQYAYIRMYTQFIYAIHNTQLPKMSIRMIRKYLFPYASIRIHTQWAVCWCQKWGCDSRLKSCSDTLWVATFINCSDTLWVAFMNLQNCDSLWKAGM